MIPRLGRIAIRWGWIVVLVGCRSNWEADYRDLNLADVSGVIRFDGVPLPHARILFEASDRTFSYGETDVQGRYRLMFNSKQPGVLPGTKIVRIRGGRSREFDNEGSRAGQPASAGSAVIPACYNEQSQLRVVVERSVTLDFELRSDCTGTGAG